VLWSGQGRHGHLLPDTNCPMTCPASPPGCPRPPRTVTQPSSSPRGVTDVPGLTALGSYSFFNQGIDIADAMAFQAPKDPGRAIPRHINPVPDRLRQHQLGHQRHRRSRQLRLPRPQRRWSATRDLNGKPARPGSGPAGPRNARRPRSRARPHRFLLRYSCWHRGIRNAIESPGPSW